MFTFFFHWCKIILSRHYTTYVIRFVERTVSTGSEGLRNWPGRDRMLLSITSFFDYCAKYSETPNSCCIFFSSAHLNLLTSFLCFLKFLSVSWRLVQSKGTCQPIQSQGSCVSALHREEILSIVEWPICGQEAVQRHVQSAGSGTADYWFISTGLTDSPEKGVTRYAQSEELKRHHSLNLHMRTQMFRLCLLQLFRTEKTRTAVC